MRAAFCYHAKVRSFSKLFAVVFLLGALLPIPASNGITDEEKKKLFLKAREEMQTVEPSPTPAATATPKPKPASHRSATPRPTPRDTPPPEPTPRPDPRAQGTPRPTAAPTRPLITIPSATPTPTGGSSRTSIPSTNHPETRPFIVIQRQAPQREAEPPPPEEPRGFWPWSGPTNYHYLTRSVISAIRNAPVAHARWRYIVVHNSGTRQGNAKIFDYYHRHTRGMPNGLAYHFVIGNGTSSGDGEIEIGNRWTQQLDGGHVHSDYLNSISLGICLVGDFNRDTPTKAQLAALDELIRYLRIRVGKYDGRVAIVKAHKDINPVPTDCPGERFPYSWLYGRFGE